MPETEHKNLNNNAGDETKILQKMIETEQAKHPQNISPKIKNKTKENCKAPCCYF